MSAMVSPDKLPEGAFGLNSVRPQRVGRYKVWLLQKRFAELSAQVEACVLEARQLVAWKQTFQPLQVADLTDDDRRIVEHNRRARLVEIVQKHCSQALKAIMQHKWAFPFNTPVDTSRFVDYLKVVATPMDFSTVRNRTEAGYYRDPKDWWSDVMLVFSNAKRYNAPGSDCHLMAQTLQEVSEEKYEKLIAPRLAEETAVTQREELHLRKRRAELANGQVADAMDAQCGMLFGLMAELHAAIREAKSMAASLCEPLTLEEKQALAATIQGLPTAQLESIVAFVASRHPPSVSQSEVPAGGAAGGAPQPSRKVQLNLGRYDPLLLRQLQHLAATCTATTALRQQAQQQQQQQQGPQGQGQGAGGLAPLGVVMPPRMQPRVASPPAAAATAAARPAAVGQPGQAGQPGPSTTPAQPGAVGAAAAGGGEAVAAPAAAPAAAPGAAPALAAAPASAPAPTAAAPTAPGAAPAAAPPAAPQAAGASSPAGPGAAGPAAAAAAPPPPAPMAPPPLGSTQRNIADVVTNATASGVSVRAGIKWPGQAVGAGVRPRARALLSLHADGPANAGEMVAACPLPQPVPLPLPAARSRAAARGLKRKAAADTGQATQAAAPAHGDGKAAAASGSGDGQELPGPGGGDGSTAMDVDEGTTAAAS